METQLTIAIPEWLKKPDTHIRRAHAYAQAHVGRLSYKHWWMRRWYNNAGLGKQLGWQDRKEKYQSRKGAYGSAIPRPMPSTPYMVFHGAARLNAARAPVVRRGKTIGFRGGKIGPQFQAFGPIYPKYPFMRKEITSMQESEIEWIARQYEEAVKTFLESDTAARRKLKKRL